MSWKRQQQNYDAKIQNRREHSAARWALEDLRQNADPSRFPDLRRKVGEIRGFSLADYRDDDVNPRLTQEEYDRFKAAYEASEEGKAERQRLEALYKTGESE